MLVVNNLYAYILNNKNKTYILKDITFKLEKGDVLGIIGKSGDGKSTLAKALLKIYDCNVFYEKGDVILNNMQITPNCRGSKISILFQNPNSYLNPSIKVGKQIQEMLTTHNKEDRKTAKIKTIQFMQEVGIDAAQEIYNYYPYQISGGMQQRVCLCIALICKPDVLILDECSSYLDKETKTIILDLIKKLHSKYNFTIVMISHDFKEIYSICNKIAIMKQGQMIEFGTKKEILLTPTHPYTMELLYDYLRYYQNLETLTFPFCYEEKINPITMLSPTHYVRKDIKQNNTPPKFNKLKEKIYETFRNE